MLPSTLSFIKALKKNNNKSWFDAHRPAYENARDDFAFFIQQVIDKHSRNDKDLSDLVAKKCIFRINRDVRFSKDKSPYKTHMGASMDRGGRKSGFAGYYFHLEPGNSFFGGGLWTPEPAPLKKVRQEIDYCLDEFENIINSRKFKTHFKELYTGENVQLVKVPQGFEKDDPAAKYLKFKSWLFLKNLGDDELLSKDLVKKTVDAFIVLQPFLHFINRALE
jgi:uncharacterized protein (TIGR02453 family)